MIALSKDPKGEEALKSTTANNSSILTHDTTSAGTHNNRDARLSVNCDGFASDGNANETENIHQLKSRIRELEDRLEVTN